MARKIEATAAHQSHGTKQTVETQAGERQKKTGKALWKFLRTRLRVLVSFQGVWGTSHEIYPNMDSAAEDEGPLPAGVIDPDGNFAVWWNLVQIIALVYVAVFVPVRVAWANEPAPFSAVWFVTCRRGQRCYSISPCCVLFREFLWMTVDESENDTADVVGSLSCRSTSTSWLTSQLTSGLPTTTKSVAPGSQTPRKLLRATSKDGSPSTSLA
jgi:hypothetical protein